MSKKLRDSAYVNDLVLYRNACEEKKLKFTLSQIENLKSVYSRQKEQEKMFFAVQHMAVPVKTDAVILNLRRSLDKSKSSSILSPNSDTGTQVGRATSRVTFSEETLMNNTKQNSNTGRASNVSMRSGNTTPGISRRPPGKKPIDHKVKIFGASTSNNTKNKVRSSIRVISPRPKRDLKSDTMFGPAGKKSTPYFAEEPEIISHVDDVGVDGDIDESDNEENDAGDILQSIEAKLLNRRASSWDKNAHLQTRQLAFAPRLSDLPPLDINIYENPCSERESREKWQKLVYSLKNSRIEDTRSEADVAKFNQDVRKKWQSTYNEIKRDRISAMIKDKMKMREGEQLTLVKFLPKSRQTNFIKEAQLSQHKM